MLALSWPGPFEVIFLLVLLAVPAAVVLVLLRASRRREQVGSAFPVIPAGAEADGPGTYRVAGVDKVTRADREITVDAASRANAQVKAELEGLIVTSVRRA